MTLTVQSTSTISPSRALIFTDLDGTLLDHFTYSFKAALPTLNTLLALNTPVIPNTSKTAAELLSLRNELNLNTPFIIENGAAVYIPIALFPSPHQTLEQNGDFWVKTFVPKRDHWLACLEAVAKEFENEFINMASMTLEDIVAATGLPKDKAKQAATRDFGEPVIWLGNLARKQRFIETLERNGANILEGGRFLHICGHCNKGDALLWLQRFYAEHTKQQPYISIALGDGKNDINMLEAADYAVVIKSPVHDAPAVNKAQNLFHTHQPGPAGWAETLSLLINIPTTDQKEISHG